MFLDALQGREEVAQWSTKEGFLNSGWRPLLLGSSALSIRFLLLLGWMPMPLLNVCSVALHRFASQMLEWSTLLELRPASTCSVGDL